MRSAAQSHWSVLTLADLCGSSLAQELLPLLESYPASRDAVFQAVREAYVRTVVVETADGSDRAKKQKSDKQAEVDSSASLKELTIRLSALIATQSHLWARFVLPVRPAAIASLS